MTEQQAIKILKEEKSWESDDRKIDAFIMGIEALEKQILIKEVLNNKTLYDDDISSKVHSIINELNWNLRKGD